MCLLYGKGANKSAALLMRHGIRLPPKGAIRNIQIVINVTAADRFGSVVLRPDHARDLEFDPMGGAFSLRIFHRFAHRDLPRYGIAVVGSTRGGA